ncbi:MAG TPA: alpha-isopropylmalate synthase regulatory domain-containing protein [Gemmatimonadaceae bacterium]|nr:alpha-isopropylmalate synthase regulatory domain-containing protein [Gemmatimonadaceae bacterium]
MTRHRWRKPTGMLVMATESGPMARDNDAGPDAVVAMDMRRQRLRLTEFTFTRTPHGRCHAEVQFEWLDGEKISGKADGIASTLGDLRLPADATLRAIEAFTKAEVQLELIGVKSMRAFDDTVVIVSVLLRKNGDVKRLLGCSLAGEDILRGVVVATLQATNRVVGNSIATR